MHDNTVRGPGHRRHRFVALLGSALAGPALAAGFTGPAAPANFSVANVGTLTGGSPTFGSASFGVNQLLLVGSNAVSPNAATSTPGCSGGVYGTVSSPCQLQVTINTPGLYSFDWSYASADADGPGGDIFGVIVNGNRIALSDPGGAVAQLGSASFNVTSSFGWFVNCTDCIGGFATATVSNFVLTPVPEPAGWLLWLGGAGGLAATTAWRRRATRLAAR